jgi:hypothetical protein
VVPVEIGGFDLYGFDEIFGNWLILPFYMTSSTQAPPSTDL